MRSDPICASSGCTQYKHAHLAPRYPVDYFVPDFGQDEDIKNSFENLKVSSALLDHEWKFKTPESWEKYRNKAKDTMYNFDPALDQDVRNTISSYSTQEGVYGPWNL